MFKRAHKFDVGAFENGILKFPKELPGSFKKSGNFFCFQSTDFKKSMSHSLNWSG